MIFTYLGFCERNLTIEKFLFHGLVSKDVVACLSRHDFWFCLKKLFKLPNVSLRFIKCKFGLTHSPRVRQVCYKD